MTNAIQIAGMSREEKLRTMEAIWADLSGDDANVESPTWHEEVLKATEARVAAGKEQTLDWAIAKQEFRKRS